LVDTPLDGHQIIEGVCTAVAARVRALQDGELMAKDENLSFALFRVIDWSDPEDQPQDEVANREEHRPLIQSPRSRIGTLVFDPFRRKRRFGFLRPTRRSSAPGRMYLPHTIVISVFAL
jgi:hypothetical protein